MKFLIIYLFVVSASFAISDKKSTSNNTVNKEKSHLEHGEHEDHDDHDDHEGEEDGHGHGHGHGGGKAMGEGKAIVEVDEKKGLKLSKEAINSLSINFEDYMPSSKIKIAKKTLVTSKSQKGLYRYRDGFFKLIDIKILKEETNHYLINTSDLSPGDKIVVSGVGLLRVSDIYSTDKSEYGHSH